METRNETPHLPLDTSSKGNPGRSRFSKEEQRDYAQRAMVSGMAQKDFARVEGIPYSSLKNWISRYKKDRGARNAAKQQEISAFKAHHDKLPTVHFKVANEVEEAQAERISQLERRVEVLEEENAALVKTVKVLGHQLVRDDEQ